MRVEITSKDELQSVANKFNNVAKQFSAESVEIVGNLSKKEDFDGINVSQASTTIQNNLKSVSRDIEVLASKLNNYIEDIKKLDTYDFNISEDVNSNKNCDDKKSALFLFKNADTDSSDISIL